VIAVNPATWPKVNAAGAKAFEDYVTGSAGQQIIAAFGIATLASRCSMRTPARPTARSSRRLRSTMASLADQAQQLFQGLVGTDLVEITLLSLAVSGVATALSLLIGVPIGPGCALAVSEPRARDHRRQHRHGPSAVVVGLVVAFALWRSGPLGDLSLMYTPSAMVVAEVIIATPVILGLTVAALGQLDPRLRLQIMGLGASRWQTVWWLWREARLPLLAALMAGFGSVISEVGAAMMVGGNILHQTRVLTTAIVLDVSRGDFGQAVVLGIVPAGPRVPRQWRAHLGPAARARH